MIKYCKKAESVSHFLCIDAKIIYAAANINRKYKGDSRVWKVKWNAMSKTML